MLSDVFSVSPEWSANFLLVLGRLSAAVVAAPLFGARNVPAQTKIGLAVLLSLIVLPLQGAPLPAAPDNIFVFAAMLGSEVMIGLALGIAIALVFHTLEMAATIVSTQMGFGLASVFDPLTGQQTGTLEQFYRVLVTLIFFAINGHYLVIGGLLQTFDVVPPGAADVSVIAGEQVVPFFISLFIAAVQVALPALGALMLTDLAMALVGRTIPQMNVLIVGMPAKVGVGLLVLVASIPFMTALIGNAMGRSLLDLNRFLAQ